MKLNPINDPPKGTVRLTDGSIYRKSYSPYVGDNGNWFEFDDKLGAYVDTGKPATGEQGPKGDAYLLTDPDKEEIAGIVKEDVEYDLTEQIEAAKETIKSECEESVGEIEKIIKTGKENITEGVEEAATKIDEAGTSNVEKVEDEGNKQLANIQEAVGDLPKKIKQIDKNTKDISQLSREVAKLEELGNDVTAIKQIVEGLGNQITGITVAEIEHMFNLFRDDREYGIRWPLWETAQSPLCEKLYDNVGLEALPSTALEYRKDDYDGIMGFRTFDVNAHVTDDGVKVIDAIKGDENFRDEGKVDVFVMGMSFHEKWYVEDGYQYYVRRFTPAEGFTPYPGCLDKDGNVMPYFLIPKYVMGSIDNVGYGSKGLAPARKLPSFNGMVSEAAKRGPYYSGMLMFEYSYILTTWWLKYSNRNSQATMYGCANFSEQAEVALPEYQTSRVILTNSVAARIPIGSSVSIGDKGSNTSTDRNNAYMHNIVDSARVIGKKIYSATHMALELEVPYLLDIPEGAILSSMPWRSGFSDNVKGRCGCPCDNVGDLTVGRHPIVFQGIELMVGAYETTDMAFMDITRCVDNVSIRDIYVTNDAKKQTTNITVAKDTFKKLPFQMSDGKVNAWQYITKMDMDEETGALIQTYGGQSGSGSATGFCDGLYLDASASGQREFLLFGYPWTGSTAGLSFLYAYYGLSAANWAICARLSISGVRGE